MTEVGLGSDRDGEWKNLKALYIITLAKGQRMKFPYWESFMFFVLILLSFSIYCFIKLTWIIIVQWEKSFSKYFNTSFINTY